MRGKYNLQISERVKGGLTIRVTNTKTEKVSKFVATEKATENGKYFYYLFQDAILKTLKK
jgi:hypothetical protein|tara:strand:- start:781 stop:960 length:180 start_codon:yes stop_codon:yes gene_type:complete